MLSGRSAGSSLRKAVNTGNSKRSSEYVISFINVSINGFIVQEWNSVLATEASMQLYFLVPPASVLLISMSETFTMISADCLKLFKELNLCLLSFPQESPELN